jgi:hypothetical protein
MIKEIHPISDTPIDTAFPILFCWWTLFKKCFMPSSLDLEDSHKEVIENLDEKIAKTKDK